MDKTEAQSEEARQRQQLINRLTRRAWLDKEFRKLFTSDPAAAVTAEFGEMPVLLRGFTLQPASVDRATLRGPGGRQTLRIRPKSGGRPISLVLRRFLGENELITVFYTRRCAFACTFCTLPSAGAITDISSDDFATQLEAMTSFVRAEQAGKITRVALGNEGSFLDERTLPVEQFGSAMAAARTVPGVQEIILETRPEFAVPATLRTVESLRGDCRVALKIGLESSDNVLRNDILGKRMELSDFDAAVRYAGSFGYSLESYVLLKAHPEHTDARACREAIETCEYIKRVCAEHDVKLTLRVNSMYMAAGSAWAVRARAAGWTPPSIFDLAEVMWAVGTDEVRVFAGVSEEGLATQDGHFVVRDDFQQWALDTIEEYNSSGDRGLLAKVAQFRAGSIGGLD